MLVNTFEDADIKIPPPQYRTGPRVEIGQNTLGEIVELHARERLHFLEELKNTTS